MKSQRGYTMVETLIVFVIIGVIAPVLGFVVQQVVTVPEKGDYQVEALHAVQNTIHWVGKDAGSAKAAVGGDTLTLTLPDDSTVTYTRTANDLFRNYKSENTAIARNITSMNFTVSGRLITMTITAAPDNRWNIYESQTYQVAMRPSGT